MLNLYAISGPEMLNSHPPYLLKWSPSALTPTHLRSTAHFALSEFMLTFAGSLQNAGSAPWAASFHIFNLFIMAKVLGIFSSKLKGKVGPVSYRNTADGNVVYQRAASVKNPRSFAQQQQRMIFATASAAYSTMKVICDHSFEGVTTGAKTQAEFMKTNLDLLRSNLVTNNSGNFNLRGNKSMVGNPLVISRGSLSPIPLEAGDLKVQNELQFAYIPKIGLPESEFTVSDLISALPGVQAGDQLTFCWLVAEEGAKEYEYGGVIQKVSTFDFARLVLPLDKTSVLWEDNGGKGYFRGADGSQGLDKLNSLVTADGSFAFTFPALAYPEAEILGAAVIVSRKVGTAWQRSTTTLTLYNAALDNASIIIGSYDPSSDLYLNHALD